MNGVGDRIYAHFSKDFKRQAHICGLTTLDLSKINDEIRDEDKVFELIVTAYDLNFASSIASSDPGKQAMIALEGGGEWCQGVYICNISAHASRKPFQCNGREGREGGHSHCCFPSQFSNAPVSYFLVDKERWPLPLLNFEALYERFIVHRKYVGAQYNPAQAIPGFPERGFTGLFEDSAYLASHLPMFITGYNTGRADGGEVTDV
jgi:hypothetical protein